LDAENSLMVKKEVLRDGQVVTFATIIVPFLPSQSLSF